MPLGMCGSCGKMISISRLPGGNPIAQRYPDMFAASFGRCDRCGRTYCDVCISNSAGKCPECGKRIDVQAPPPGEAAPMPEEYARVLDGLDNGTVSSKPKQESGWSKGIGKLLKALAVLAVPAGLAFVVVQLSTPDETAHRLAWIALNLIGVFAVLALVSPVVGTLSAGLTEMVLLRLAGPKRTLAISRSMILLHLLALVLSPWLIYHAHYVWQLPGWWIAYFYTAVVGALLGGLAMLAQVTKKLGGADS